MTDARQIAREIVPERDLVTLLNEDLVLAARLLAYLRPRIAAALAPPPVQAEAGATVLQAWDVIEPWATRLYDKPTTADWLALRDIVLKFALDQQTALRARTAEREVVEAVLYAMRCGCFFPVPEPASATVEELTRWGAMRNLHDKVAALSATPVRGGDAG